MSRGAFKLEGGAELRVLAVELKTADRALLLALRRNLRAVTRPAGAVVQAHEREVLPKAGGLNEWVSSTPVSTRILTGPRSAGVRIVQSKKGHVRAHDLARMNDEGVVRHPVFARPDQPRVWVEQDGIARGFWEEPLLAMEPQVAAAMRLVMIETERAAGFR